MRVRIHRGAHEIGGSCVAVESGGSRIVLDVGRPLANSTALYLIYFRYTVGMRVIEHPFSDLLRRPKEVTSDVDEGDVLLRRRDEPDLRLTRADRDADCSAAFAALGRTMRNLAVHSPKALDNALPDAFPWMEVLPAKERHLFLHEFSRVIVATSELDNYAPMSQLIREWRATADIHADPRLARRLKRPIDAEGAPVKRPAA